MAGCGSPKVEQVKKLVAAELRDPASAQFTDVRLGQKNWVCGSVNAKNEFGALTGPRRFVGIGKEYVAIEPPIGDSMRELFDENWAECTGTPPPPDAEDAVDRLDNASRP